MYCSNCGNKLDEKAVVCPKCGVPVAGKEIVSVKGNHPSNGKSVASMVLGIIGAVFALIYLAGAIDVDWSMQQQMLYDSSYRFGFALGSILVPLTLAIISISLAVSARKVKKNGQNTAGFWLAISTFAVCAIIFLIVLSI